MNCLSAVGFLLFKAKAAVIPSNVKLYFVTIRTYVPIKDIAQSVVHEITFAAYPEKPACECLLRRIIRIPPPSMPSTGRILRIPRIRLTAAKRGKNPNVTAAHKKFTPLPAARIKTFPSRIPRGVFFRF